MPYISYSETYIGLLYKKCLICSPVKHNMWFWNYNLKESLQIWTYYRLINSIPLFFFSADGVYTMTLRTKAKLTAEGKVKWRPPASLKSSCTMDVRYFPFDEQKCEMKFGSWTYNLNEVSFFWGLVWVLENVRLISHLALWNYQLSIWAIWVRKRSSVFNVFVTSTFLNAFRTKVDR